MEDKNIFYEALNVLGLPPFVTKNEIKKRYRKLAREFHPDISNDKEQIVKINAAYKLLMEYIEDFRYSFDEQELSKQIPGFDHNGKFNGVF